MMELILYGTKQGILATLLLIGVFLFVLVVEVLIGVGQDGIMVTMVAAILFIFIVNIFLLFVVVPIALVVLSVLKWNLIAQKIQELFDKNIDIQKFSRNTMRIFWMGLLILPVSLVLWIWGGNL